MILYRTEILNINSSKFASEGERFKNNEYKQNMVKTFETIRRYIDIK